MALSLSAHLSLAQSGKSAARTHRAAPTPTGPTVVFDTTMGRLVCRLYAAQAPELTANFISLATGAQVWKDPLTGVPQPGKPFYDGTAIYGLTDAVTGGDRVGGGLGTAGEPLPGAKTAGLAFDRPGRLAMAIRKGKISRSSFVISVHADAEMDENDRGAIFGQCDDATVELAAKISHLMLTTDNHPSSPVAINKISIVQPDQPLPPVAPDVPVASVVPQPTPPPVSTIAAPEPTGPTAKIETSMGTLTCRLFEKEAPVATGVFIGLAEGTKAWTMPHTHVTMRGKPFYNGLLFNRVLPDFMIQNQNYPGGSTGGGEIGIQYSIEIVPGLNFDRPGRLAMANSGPDENDSSFFITDAPRHSGLDDHFTIFGQCDDASVKIVSEIARVPRDAHNRPVTPVVIRRVTIVR
ncbi:peptidyl-prolyl cis-trans isomerase A (cyclophilin A) [Granulicella rosea]|uniref:peptidylprolyl isomerase n=1 Tax=Granulicella rosea TaxID=474952 RepID=A0A239DWL0_9BACT|nr:peptidylprolyl isomerase [Granulicella rosea]SNS36083.1 peptidyl-prolyl cis-trans isomerase A (cyclophilin A) [Granulicella rosea]